MINMRLIHDHLDEIRRMYRAGISTTVIAERIGFARRTVSRLVHEQGWAQHNPNRSASIRLSWRRRKGEI